MPEPLSRRTTLKAGAHAAWAVPAISVVAATPAYAVSGGPVLALTVISAVFVDDRPDNLALTLDVENTGDTAATGLLVTVFVPPGLYETAPIVTDMAALWTPLPTEGSATDGWVLSASYSEAIEAHSSVFFGFPVMFQDGLDEPPYRRWAGHAFGATVVVSSPGAAEVTAPAPVAESPLTRFDIPRDTGYSGQFQDNVVVLNGYAVNVGRKSTSELALRVWWNPAGDDPAWTQPPVDANSPELGIGTVEGGGASGDDPWYIRFPAGPTAPVDSLTYATTFEELAPSRVKFSVAITLAANPALAPKDFYATIRGADVLEPVPGVHSWQSALVTPYIPDP